MRLLIVDDHPVMRDGLAALLEHAAPDTVVVHAANAPAAIELASGDPALDCVLLDLSMPGMDGFMALSALRQRCPLLPIIVLSSSEDPADIRRALSLGARGYIPKSAASRTVIAALQLVLSGGTYVPLLALEPGPAAGAAAGAGRLTLRQIDVLTRLGEGLSNKGIAAEMGLSEKTVKAHVGAIFRTLDVANRTQAVNEARRTKLIS